RRLLLQVVRKPNHGPAGGHPGGPAHSPATVSAAVGRRSAVRLVVSPVGPVSAVCGVVAGGGVVGRPAVARWLAVPAVVEAGARAVGGRVAGGVLAVGAVGGPAAGVVEAAARAAVGGPAPRRAPGLRLWGQHEQ